MHVRDPAGTEGAGGTALVAAVGVIVDVVRRGGDVSDGRGPSSRCSCCCCCPNCLGGVDDMWALKRRQDLSLRHLRDNACAFAQKR